MVLRVLADLWSSGGLCPPTGCWICFLVRLVNQAHAWSAGYVEHVSLILFDPFAFGRYLVVENLWISLAKLASHHRETPSQCAFGISLKAPLLGMYSRWNALCGHEALNHTLRGLPPRQGPANDAGAELARACTA